MRKDPALTYRGALRLLGKTDQRVVNALDALVGGLILASPVTPLAAAWGWIEQKNEALSLVRKLVSATAKKITKVSGYERYELISAAHTVIIIAAFFDTLKQFLGKSKYARLELSEREKAMLATGTSAPAGAEQLVSLLVSADTPLPSAGGGLAERADLVTFYETLLETVQTFLQGLEAWKEISKQAGPLDGLAAVPSTAARKYHTYFLGLAADVPEFYLWASLSEHGVTRKQIQEAHVDLSAALDEQLESMGRLNRVLAQLTKNRDDPPARARTIMARANLSVLTETIIPVGSLEHIADITVPTIERVYQSPCFRTAVASAARPADENWWARQPKSTDLDLLFASFLASPESVSTPLLLLGHPGAGKSLLTKVLAARLPTQSYTAVRVPLRRVDADAPVFEQIQQSLDLTTNRRVSWTELVEEGRDTTRVVILDGLDELLQASSNSRASYLQEVADFQRREADQELPVAFIVTSRTVVADRVRIAPNTTVVKLDGFTDDQIGSWLGIWHAHNRDSITAGRMGAFPVDVALRLRELANQPLLLLLLALYAADPNAEQLGEQALSGSAFYGHILTSFIQREVAKGPSDDIAELVEDQMWRLGIAAFAMFNRDRQDIGDDELGADIVALTESETADTNRVTRWAKVGQATIGKFFFVYTAEADAHRDEETQRAYEFLHATFGEYLVAHYCVRVLVEVAKTSRLVRRGGREFDDDLLFALLSHQTLTTRRSTVTFIRELFTQLDDGVQRACERALTTLIHNYRKRSGTNSYAGYRPLQVDRVRQAAAYSANLILLRLLVADNEHVPIDNLSPSESDDETWWYSTVSLWRAALGESGWESISRALDITDTGYLVGRTQELPPWGNEIGYFQLTRNNADLARHQHGYALHGYLPPSPVGTREARLVSYLIYASTQEILPSTSSREPYLREAKGMVSAAGITNADVLYRSIITYLAKHGAQLGYRETIALVRLALKCKSDASSLDLSPFVPSVATFSQLLVDIPELRDASAYEQDWVVSVLLAAELAGHQRHASELRTLRDAVQRHLGVGPGWADSRDGFLIMIRGLFRVADAIDRKRPPN